jgi:hypothetical protein
LEISNVCFLNRVPNFSVPEICWTKDRYTHIRQRFILVNCYFSCCLLSASILEPPNLEGIRQTVQKL